MVEGTVPVTTFESVDMVGGTVLQTVEVVEGTVPAATFENVKMVVRTVPTTI